MTEVKTLTKIALLAYGIACLLFGFMLIFMTATFLDALVPGWEVNVFHPRVLGGFLVVIGFFDFLMIPMTLPDMESYFTQASSTTLKKSSLKVI